MAVYDDAIRLEFAIPQDVSGGDLRDLLIRFQRAHSTLNTARDEAQLEKEMIAAAIEATEAEAMIFVSETYRGQRPGAELKKAEAKLLPISQGGWSVINAPKSAIDLEHDLAVATFRVRRAASRLRELETAIDVIRSALAWDRKELDRMGD